MESRELTVFNRAPHAIQLVGQLVYRNDERQFDFVPHPVDTGFTSLLVNDVRIEVGEDGTLLYVWGYCPHESWVPTQLLPPRAVVEPLVYAAPQPLIPGVSKRLASQWPCAFDAATGRLCIGDAAARADPVTFAPGATAMLVQGELVALWLTVQRELR